MNFGVFKQQKACSSASFSILFRLTKQENIYVSYPEGWVSV